MNQKAENICYETYPLPLKGNVVDNRVLEWLLENKDPSIRFRTLTELLGQRLSEKDYQEQKSAIYTSKAVKKFFDKMETNGDWLVNGKLYTGTGAENIGPGFCISHLSELAVDKSYPPMDHAAKRFLSRLQNYCFGEYPCGDALWLRAVVLIDFRSHPVVQHAIEMMSKCVRWDGGCLCTRDSFSNVNKSCLHGSQNMLLAFAELPELWDTPQCRQLVDYFLERRVYFKRDNYTQKPKGDLGTIFPFNLRQGLIEPLYALSKMGYGNRPEMADAWNLLDSKRTPEGSYILDWTPPRTYLKGGKKGHPSKWITLYSLLALKHRDLKQGKAEQGAAPDADKRHR